MSECVSVCVCVCVCVCGCLGVGRCWPGKEWTGGREKERLAKDKEVLASRVQRHVGPRLLGAWPCSYTTSPRGGGAAVAARRTVVMKRTRGAAGRKSRNASAPAFWGVERERGGAEVRQRARRAWDYCQTSRRGCFLATGRGLAHRRYVASTCQAPDAPHSNSLTSDV